MNKIQQFLEKVKDALDIKKHLPENYIHQKIFQGALVTAALLLFITLLSNGMQTTFIYAQCNQPQCVNPFYVCPTDFDLETYDVDIPCMLEEQVPAKIRAFIEDYKDIKLMSKGEVFGRKPNFLFRHFKAIFSIIIVFAFGYNHYQYKRETK